MLLERLILKNFKRFRDQEIRFTDGVIGIIGNNGTGKSSIVEGILFALYGLSGTGIRGDFIVSSFAGPRERCEVRMDFQVRGQGFTVRRSFRKGSTTQHEAWLNRGEKLLAQGVSEVDREVTRILGMSATDLRNTIYAGQKDLVSLLESRPGERREWFSRVLGIDYLKEQSLALLRERVDHTERACDRLEGEVSTLNRLVEGESVARLEPSRIELEQAISSHHEAIGTLASSIGNQEERLEAFQQEKSRFSQLSEQRKTIERDLELLGRRKRGLEEQLGSLEKKAAGYERLQQDMEGYPLRREIFEQEQKRKARWDRLLQERLFAERRLADLGKRETLLREKERENTDSLHQQIALLAEVKAQSGCPPEVKDTSLEEWIREEERDLILQIGRLNETIKACGVERERILSDWENIHQVGQAGVCPLCHQHLGEHFPHLVREYEDQLQDLVGRAEKACELLEVQEQERSRLAALRPQLARIRSGAGLEKERISLEQDRHALDQEKAKVLREREQVSQEIHALNFDESGFSVLEQEIKTKEPLYRRFQETGKLIAALPVLRQQRDDALQEERDKQKEREGILEELAASSYDPLAEDALRTELRRLQEERIRREADLARDLERRAKILESLRRLKDTEEQIRQVKQQQADLQEETRLLKLTRSTISDFVVYLMQVVRAQIEQTTGEVLSVITGERYDRVLLDSEFNLRISDMDNDYPIERFSGGEQDDIAVALRLALSHYLAELHQIHDSTFLIFDEIFASQDEERRSNLLRALRTQESRFPQIILISHIPEIQGEFASTLVVEMESDQTSVVREAS